MDRTCAICPLRKHKKRAVRKDRPTWILYHKAGRKVHSHFVKNWNFFLMKYPILKSKKIGCIMKIQKRSESNVLSKLSPIKTEESRGYVNAGTQQLLKPLTFMCQGFFFCHFRPKSRPRGRFFIVRQSLSTERRLLTPSKCDMLTPERKWHPWTIT